MKMKKVEKDLSFWLQEKSKQNSYQVVHFYREANTCADYLTKLGVKRLETRAGMKMWSDAPPGLGYLLLKDTRVPPVS